MPTHRAPPAWKSSGLKSRSIEFTRDEVRYTVSSRVKSTESNAEGLGRIATLQHRSRRSVFEGLREEYKRLARNSTRLTSFTEKKREKILRDGLDVKFRQLFNQECRDSNNIFGSVPADSDIGEVNCEQDMHIFDGACGRSLRVLWPDVPAAKSWIPLVHPTITVCETEQAVYADISSVVLTDTGVIRHVLGAESEIRSKVLETLFRAEKDSWESSEVAQSLCDNLQTLELSVLTGSTSVAEPKLANLKVQGYTVCVCPRELFTGGASLEDRDSQGSKVVPHNLDSTTVSISLLNTRSPGTGLKPIAVRMSVVASADGSSTALVPVSSFTKVLVDGIYPVLEPHILGAEKLSADERLSLESKCSEIVKTRAKRMFAWAGPGDFVDVGTTELESVNSAEAFRVPGRPCAKLLPNSDA